MTDFGRVVERRARLDLDEDQQRARRARDDVDLAERALPAPRQDAIALGDQTGGGAALRRKAEAEGGDLPLRPRLRPRLGRAAGRYARAIAVASFASASAR